MAHTISGQVLGEYITQRQHVVSLPLGRKCFPVSPPFQFREWGNCQNEFSPGGARRSRLHRGGIGEPCGWSAIGIGIHIVELRRVSDDLAPTAGNPRTR